MRISGKHISVVLAIACMGFMASPTLAQGRGNGNGNGGGGGGDPAPGDDPFADLPSGITLRGVVRDFRERHVPGGHPDFEKQPDSGFGLYQGIVADDLDADGKPVFAGTGHKISAQWMDSQGRPIIAPRAHIQAMSGDQAGSASGSEGGAVTDADSISSWYRDTAGLNMSTVFPILLEREPGTNKYIFDDSLNTQFAQLGGFFIVNDRLYGNSQGGNKNFHFTYEIDTQFIYEQGAGQVFAFTGDDDVWVYIDGKIVIDIGGVHGAQSQTIALDRLNWLEDGQAYTLKFFFAERHRTQSNFRIETTLQLRNLDLPPTTALYD